MEWTERREEGQRARLITDVELRDIWAALRDDAYGDILRLLILTGARREEIGGLQWSEVDLTTPCIILPAERPKIGASTKSILATALSAFCAHVRC